MTVPEHRILSVNAHPVRAHGEYVLYWMIAARRPRYNFGLQRAVQWARELRKPLVVFEPLRSGYPWASDRLHAFVLQGMAANAVYFPSRGVTYFPYVEPAHDEGRGLLAALADRAAVVVTDDFPAFFLRRMVTAAAGQLAARLEAVDSNGILPLTATDRAYPTAVAFRRVVQGSLRRHLSAFPEEEPAADPGVPRLGELPARLTARWPAAGPELLDASAAALASLPIDHSVPPVEGARGGSPRVASRSTCSSTSASRATSRSGTRRSKR